MIYTEAFLLQMPIYRRNCPAALVLSPTTLRTAQRCSRHCMSCRGSHHHPCSPHRLQTSEQLQDQHVFRITILKVSKTLRYDRLVSFIPVGGRVSFTKMKIAFSALSLIRFLTTYTNCPTVRSAGTRYLHGVAYVRNQNLEQVQWYVTADIIKMQDCTKAINRLTS
jgi:NADH pyrophosphatase NudC (nudix superfamily)